MKLWSVELRLRGALEAGDPLTHAPHLGKHTREIVGEMGYGAGDIDKLSVSGVVGCYRGLSEFELGPFDVGRGGGLGRAKAKQEILI